MKITLTSKGKALRPWNVRAGMLIVETRYDHDAQTLSLEVVDERQIAAEIARGLRETANGVGAAQEQEEIHQAADNIDAMFGNATGTITL